MPKIKAAVCHAFGKPLIVEKIDLRAPLRGEIEVKIGAVAICHSDISYSEGAWGGTLPAVYGHEAAGKITALGNSVDQFNVGDRVVVTLIRSCGYCNSCGSGKPTICETYVDTSKGPIRTADGGILEQGMNCGAFAEKVVVDHSQVVKIPNYIDYEVASLLACGVVTGIGAVVNAAKVRPGQDVVVRVI